MSRIPDGGFFARGPVRTPKEMPLRGMPEWFRKCSKVLVENNTITPVTVQGLKKLLAGLNPNVKGGLFDDGGVVATLADGKITSEISIERFIAGWAKGGRDGIKIKIELIGQEGGIISISQLKGIVKLKVPFIFVDGKIEFTFPK